MTNSTSNISRIFIYEGHRVMTQGSTRCAGPFPGSVTRLMRLFSQTGLTQGKQWHLQCVAGGELMNRIKGPYENTLLVIPPGPSSAFDTLFSDKEIAWLRRSHELGLHLFSICGSAYWLCKQREWHGVRKEGTIGLVDAIAIGPIASYTDPYEQSNYLNEVVSLSYNTRSAKLLLSGGGSFCWIPSGLMKSTKVLSTYPPSTLKQFKRGSQRKNAIIKSQSGKGIAILSMVHPEYGKKEICLKLGQALPKRKENWTEIRQSLSSKKERLAFVAALIEEYQTPL